MGNTLKAAKLMDSYGNLRQLKTPIKAAKLMLEQPGYIICPMQELRLTRRLLALRAEDELLPGKFYLLVALSKLNHKISDSELGIIESAACKNKSTKGQKSTNKVLPVIANDEQENREVEEELINTGFAGCRFKKFSQWTPVLEPIAE